MPRPLNTAIGLRLAPLAALAVGLALSDPAVAQTAPPLDRYGGGELYGAPQAALRPVATSSPALPYRLRPRTPAPSALAGMRTLSWAGKAEGAYPPGRPAAPAPARYATAAYAAPKPYPTQPANPASAPRLAYAATRPADPRPFAPAAQVSAVPSAASGWVPFDAAAYAPAHTPASPAPAAAPRWTPPPTRATIYDPPAPRPQVEARADAEPPRAAALRPTRVATLTPPSKAALPRSAWGSMPPPRGYRPVQAEPVQPPQPASPYLGTGVRHYSLHRDFGIRPDATPIPPQFFTATADLSAETNGSQPAGPDPLARKTSSGLSSAQARATAATTADAAQ